MCSFTIFKVFKLYVFTIFFLGAYSMGNRFHYTNCWWSCSCFYHRGLIQLVSFLWQHFYVTFEFVIVYSFDNLHILTTLTRFCGRAGFLSAMASNLTNQSRNVLSKKVMVKKDVSFLCTDQNFPLHGSILLIKKQTLLLCLRRNLRNLWTTSPSSL